MTVVLLWLLVVATILIIIPSLVLLIQVIFSLRSVNKEAKTLVRRPSLAVLIPAHDEAAVIGNTLASIMQQRGEGDRVVVVADNCSDRTAEIAEGAGAEVTRRDDDENRGKGYALDHGIAFLKKSAAQPDVVIFIDADCYVKNGCLDELLLCCAETNRPVQVQSEMAFPELTDRKLIMLSAFAWRVKNFVRPLGWSRLGFPCLLQGTGMAFPWGTIAKTNLASDNIVEDLNVTIDLALRGHFALFLPSAGVVSQLARRDEIALKQQTRWEHGTLASMIQYLPILLGRAIADRSLNLLGIALDLYVPPLALLVLLVTILLGLNVLFFTVTGLTTPLWLSALAALFIFCAVSVAWLRHGRSLMSFGDLMLVPIYALGKLPMYGKFLINRERRWVRTERD